MLKVNDVAPQFRLLNQEGKLVSLSGFLGRKVVLYFYPLDFTEGCSLQAQSFGKYHAEFLRLGYEVIGVSRDEVEAHKRFCTAYKLPFILLSDPQLEAIKAYGVDIPDFKYGDLIIKSRRVTFVINENGLITHVFPDVDPETSSGELLEILAK